MSNDALTEVQARKMLTLALAANDLEHRLWPPEGRQRAILIWNQSQGYIPSADAIAKHIGEDLAQSYLPFIVQRRKFFNSLVGYRSPCHYCKSTTSDLQSFDFALTAVTSRGWAGTAVSAAASLATIPLFGVGALVLPGSSYKGMTLHLRIVVCPSCKSENKNIFGLFMINKSRAAHHPMWSELHDAGFAKYADFTDMPIGTTVSFGHEDF